MEVHLWLANSCIQLPTLSCNQITVIETVLTEYLPLLNTLAVTNGKFDLVLRVQLLATWSSRGFHSQTVMRARWQAGNFPLANITSPIIVKLAT